jgi:hypothetical protein
MNQVRLFTVLVLFFFRIKQSLLFHAQSFVLNASFFFTVPVFRAACGFTVKDADGRTYTDMTYAFFASTTPKIKALIVPFKTLHLLGFT